MIYIFPAFPPFPVDDLFELDEASEELVFCGTDVPVLRYFEYVGENGSPDGFAEQYPTVKKEQVEKMNIMLNLLKEHCDRARRLMDTN